MHPYDFILILFSFVYAAAVTHICSRKHSEFRLPD
jgi:hypothetical protein